ncbi:MAG: hypothetical protein ACTS6G_02235 [Candidatus Hodgkinia cicadicola]
MPLRPSFATFYRRIDWNSAPYPRNFVGTPLRMRGFGRFSPTKPSIRRPTPQPATTNRIYVSLSRLPANNFNRFVLRLGCHSPFAPRKR